MRPQTPEPAGRVDEDGPDRPWLRHYDDHVPLHLSYPRMPLYRLLDDAAAAQPEHNCTLFFGRRCTYAKIRADSDRFAAALQALGIRKGDRVALLLPNSPQFIICYYGALKAGAVVVPLNPLYTTHELAFQFRHSGAETVVTLPQFLDKVESLRQDTALRRVIFSRLADFLPLPASLVQGWRERRLLAAARDPSLIDLAGLLAKPAPAGWQPEAVDPDEMALLIYSGGTTGAAKGIMLSHFNLVANACQLVAWAKLSAEERMLAVLPLFHGFGMSVTMNAALMSGGDVVLQPRFRAHDVVEAMQKYRPTFFIGVPTMFVALSNLPDIGRYDLSSLKGIFVGAAPLTQGIKDGFEARTGARMIEGYGLTEAVTAIMANPHHGQHKLGSIGLPFSDVDMKIVGLEDGCDLPPGATGEIVLRSPTVMLGYYKDAEATAAALRDGWLFTGDIGHMDEDGYFYITDRKKELIIVSGFNVFPREIDEVIYQHPKVQEGIAVGIPDPYQGERIKAYIVLKPGATATAEEMIAFFRERLSPYKVPREVEFRNELPKSMIGKILRRSLRDEEIARQAAQPETDVNPG